MLFSAKVAGDEVIPIGTRTFLQFRAAKLYPGGLIGEMGRFLLRGIVCVSGLLALGRLTGSITSIGSQFVQPPLFPRRLCRSLLGERKLRLGDHWAWYLGSVLRLRAAYLDWGCGLRWFVAGLRDCVGDRSRL